MDGATILRPLLSLPEDAVRYAKGIGSQLLPLALVKYRQQTGMLAAHFHYPFAGGHSVWRNPPWDWTKDSRRWTSGKGIDSIAGFGGTRRWRLVDDIYRPITLLLFVVASFSGRFVIAGIRPFCLAFVMGIGYGAKDREGVL